MAKKINPELEEYQKKRTTYCDAIRRKIKNGPDKEFSVKDTKFLIKVYKLTPWNLIRDSVKVDSWPDDFDYTKIKLVKDTDWHTDYDLLFYKNGECIFQNQFKHSAFRDIYVDMCYQYACIKYPLKEEEIKKHKSYKLNFGKYKGKSIQDIYNIDAQYIEWVLKTTTFEKKLKKKIKSELQIIRSLE